MCVHNMVLDVEYEQQGQNKYSWKYNICPLLTLNLMKWYKSVGSLSLKSVNVESKQKKSHGWFREMFSGSTINTI